MNPTYLASFQAMFLPDFNEENELYGSGLNLEAHTPYALEKLLFTLIRDGQTEQLQRLLEASRQRNFQAAIGRVSKDSLRQLKYLAVSACTLAVRSAMDGGLRETEAYQASDEFIQRIDEENDPELILIMTFNLMLDMASRVREGQRHRIDSLHIRKARLYIEKHLLERIRPGDVAAACSLSFSYFSALFRKNTGLAPSEFIMQEKIRMAQTMILTHDIPPSKVGHLLGFCSQSHFIACFRKATGLTPRAYREAHREA